MMCTGMLFVFTDTRVSFVRDGGFFVCRYDLTDETLTQDNWNLGPKRIGMVFDQ